MGDTWADVQGWLWHLVNDPVTQNRWSAALGSVMLVAPFWLVALLWIRHFRMMGKGAMSDDIHTVAGHGTDDTEPGTVAEEFGPMYAEEDLRPDTLADADRTSRCRQMPFPVLTSPMVRPYALEPDAYTGVHSAPDQAPGRHAAPVPREHDLTAVDYAFTPRNEGRAGHIASWSAWRKDDKPQPGDHLILNNPGGTRSKTSRYRVVSMNPCWDVDPPTMWTAELVFDPRMHTDADA